jgi:putative transcriptional regulator
MPIQVNLDVVLAQRKVRLNELAEAIEITATNLSILKTGKAKAIRFSTLDAICRFLKCQPSDILQYIEPSPDRSTSSPSAQQLSTYAANSSTSPITTPATPAGGSAPIAPRLSPE